jgi:hypothetical protein
MLGCLSAIFSLMADGLWMAAAYGKSVEFSWQDPRAITVEELPSHQAKWNPRAALCVPFAAIVQAILFLVEKWAVLIP